jgi:hypothetical protein
MGDLGTNQLIPERSRYLFHRTKLHNRYSKLHRARRKLTASQQPHALACCERQPP